MLVTSITSFGNQETRLFNSRVFLFLGDISYGIYILQYPVYVFFTHYILTINSGLSLFYYMLFLISVGGLAYFSIEKPAKTLILSLYNKRKFNSVILADKMV
ncbi:peptidoglycan/LPS O-acetylase OafA/YrhL [Mucilaginibacter gotjawali]|nr:peptidoglycan/LPS O-acetylase OafA/YrhL [Mucilaginibacter gotjawali]